MAGISRSVTLTIAYIMAFFNLSMQDAYQYVKDKRPAISPNLNFMGQLVEFEHHCQENGPKDKRNINSFTPTQQQKDMSKKLMEKIVRTGSTASLTGKIHIYEPSRSIDKGETDGSTVGNNKPFVLKPLNPKTRRPKKLKESFDTTIQPCNAPSLENSKPTMAVTPEKDDRSNTLLNPTADKDKQSDKDLLSTCETVSSFPGPSADEGSFQRPSRPRSPRQVTVLSIKGEKLNLTHRREGRSPSPTPVPSTGGGLS